MAQNDSFRTMWSSWQRSYVPDYIGWVILFVTYILTKVLIPPFHRMFFLNDHNIQYPHAEIERVSVGWLFIYSVATPLSVLVLWTVAARPGWHKAHVTILGLAVSLILSSFLVEIVKVGAGRPRPDLLSRCKPKKGTPRDEPVTIDVCTETAHHLLQDGWKSFPSGHSSFSGSGLGYLALFFAGQLHTLRPAPDLIRVLITLLPVIGTVMIAIARTEDYRHDVYDVTSGLLFGYVSAWIAYRLYYPSPRSPRCDTPYPDRREASGAAYAKLRDEEARPGMGGGGGGGGASGGTGRDGIDSERVPLRTRSRENSRA